MFQLPNFPISNKTTLVLSDKKRAPTFFRRVFSDFSDDFLCFCDVIDAQSVL